MPVVQQKRSLLAYIACLMLAVALVGTSRDAAAAAKISLERPGDREFVRDLAEMINAADKEKIRSICDKLLTDKATPVIVVTIDSMAQYGGEGMRIETFALLLFNQWEIGQAKLNGKNWNTGILLL